MTLRPPPRCVCLDIDGTLTDGILGPPLPGAREAVARLRSAFEVRLLTNATSRSHREMAEWLASSGLLDSPGHLITPARVAEVVLVERGHQRGHILVEPEAREDFAWFTEDLLGPAVLLATEAHDRTLADLQPIFRALLGGAHLYTLQENRYFRRAGELVTDLGPVAAFLAHASGRPWENLGKPSRLMFSAAAADARCRVEDLVMAGDDAEFDASGAVRQGLPGILVRTGKYRPGDESGVDPRPTVVIDSVADLPEWLGMPASGA